MKILDPSEVAAHLPELLEAVEGGEDGLITRDGKPVARLSKISRINRQPGILADTPAWKDFKYDPSIFAPLETDEDLAAEGWPV